MSRNKEKGGPAKDRPIPHSILAQDHAETNEVARVLQASRLIRGCPVSRAMAAILAPMIYGEVSP